LEDKVMVRKYLKLEDIDFGVQGTVIDAATLQL